MLALDEEKARIDALLTGLVTQTAPQLLAVFGVGVDTAAAVDALLARPEVTAAGILGHSMGGAGALLAAAAHPGVAAVVVAAAPAGPYQLTRLTFRLARLPFPDPLAYPLAALTTHVFVRPRGHAVRRISTTRAAARYRGSRSNTPTIRIT